MATTVKVDVKINNKAINSMLDQLLDDTTKLQCHNSLARIVNPWVPMLTGQLSQHISIQPDGIYYLQPYARYQYYGVGFNHTKDYHPLASAMWDKVALSVKRKEFLAEIEQILYRKARMINGSR